MTDSNDKTPLNPQCDKTPLNPLCEGGGGGGGELGGTTN
mgnify:CR=1 FL=1